MIGERVRLSSLKPGEKMIVERIEVRESIRRRLMDIGMIEGTVVECALKSPFNDPTAYFIRGALIAIRKDDAKDVFGTILKEDTYE